MPRTTPPAFKTMLPVVFAILRSVLEGWDGRERRRRRTRGLRLGCLGAPVVVLAMRNVDMVSEESVGTTPMSS